MVVGTISVATQAGDELDTSTVREWVSQGRILSVEQIAKQNEDRIAAKILDVEVEEKHGQILYEFQVINAQGDVRELYFDAQSGSFVKEEEKD
jgi:uncharacterized membrane protein YkoI